MFTVFVIIIIHSLYSIDVSCRYPNSMYGNLPPLNCLVNEATIKVHTALAEQVLAVCILHCAVCFPSLHFPPHILQCCDICVQQKHASAKKRKKIQFDIKQKENFTHIVFNLNSLPQHHRPRPEVFTLNL